MSQGISKLLQVLDCYEMPTFLVSYFNSELLVQGCNLKFKDYISTDIEAEMPIKLNEFFATFSSKSDVLSKKVKKHLNITQKDQSSTFSFDFNGSDQSPRAHFKIMNLTSGGVNLYLFHLRTLQKEDKDFQSDSSQISFYKKLFESLPIGLGVTRIDDDSIVFANRRLEEIYGWPIEDMKNVSSFFKRVYPDKDYREKISKMILEDIASGEPERMNWKNITITTKGGKQKVVNAKNIPLYDENLMISTVLDMTDSFIAQKDLQIANERLDKAFKATSDALWEWELSEDELYWGDGYDRLFGYDVKGNKVSKAFWESKIHPGDFDPFFNSLNAALEDKNTSKWSFVYRFLDSENEYANVRENVIIIRDDNGEPIRLIGALQDITKAIKRENHLNLLEKLVANARDAILVTKVESNSFLESEIIYANPSTKSLFGFDVSELVGRTAKSFLVTPKNEPEFVEMEQHLSLWESVDKDVLSLTRNNTEFWNNVFISPIMDDEGWYTHWMVVNRNVNIERTNVEKQELITFTHKAFQDEGPLENSFCKLALKMENLFRNNLTEFWLKDTNSEKLEKCFRFKNGKRLDVDIQKENTAHKHFLSSILKSENPLVSLHELENEASVKLSYGFKVQDQSKAIGIAILCFPDTYSEKSTLDKIFNEFSIQLGTELSRKLTEFRISSFFTHTPDILFIIKKDNHIRRINQRASDILGYKKEEFFELDFTNFVIEKHKEKSIEIIDKARESEEYFSEEIIMKAKSGNRIDMDWTAFSLKGSNEIFCVARNISEYKANLRSLKTQNQKFQIINKTVKDAIWDFDLIKNEIEWGDGLQKSFGYDPDNFGVAGEVWAGKVHEKDRAKVLKSFKSLILNKKENNWREEYSFQKNDGTYVNVLDRGTIIRDENGKAIRMVGSMQDISELKNYKK
ncbi:PAS domain-containing protein [Psychroflexus tropicus]|uniref:PAS domain-containing protein n=1 Tax=Psychroflexus tropicus TaxID=197345 RepID=UPI00037F3700|nr:PAS domain-containing protein [Psychroflexus tropicus]